MFAKSLSISANTPTSLGLGQKNPFINFDLELTENEQDSLKKLNIMSINHYENYGDMDILQEEVSHYISSLGEGNPIISETIAKLIVRLIQKIIKFTSQETAWITIRAFTPISAFIEPRWHADRYDYPPTGEQFKAAITLKGSSTLFYNATDEERQALEKIRSDKDMLKSKLDESKVVYAKSGEGTLFIIGATYAPFHSEPNIEKERLFISVVPGSNQQIHGIRQQTPEHEIIPLLVDHGFYCYFVGPRIRQKFTVSPYEDTELIVFKSIDTDEIDLLKTISKIVQSHHQKIRSEVIVRDRPLLRFIFPEGGAILINDISSLFLKRKLKVTCDKDIEILLKEYASSRTQLEKKPETATHTHEFAFNTIIGKNTAGLFKPNPLANRNNPLEHTITPKIQSKL